MPSQVIDLSNLTTDLGFIIEGDMPGDQAGFSVSSAGDVNGDGIADIIVGAPRGDDGGTDAGEAYVIYGTAGERGRLDLTNLAATDGFIIQGDADDDRAGRSVASAGDVNGDGIDDIIVGATGGNGTGEAYVIYGTSDARGTLELENLTSTEGFIIQGDKADDQAGVSVSSAGDVNGDGIADIIVGATGGDDGGDNAGEAYVIYGTTDARDTLDLGDLELADGFIIQGDNKRDAAGTSVSSAGDVNGDGIDDIIVGARLGDVDDVSVGETFVVYGTTEERGKLDLTRLAPADGFVIEGKARSDQTGRAVSSAGDVNGDGIDDIIVGAPSVDIGGNDADAGEAFVIYGTTEERGTLDLNNLSRNDGFIIRADTRGDEAGFSVSSAGDVNGDGIADIIVGARFSENGRGEAYVIYGTTEDRGTLDMGNLDSTDGFTLLGDGRDDNAGVSVSSGGDVNGDGIDDIVVGAPGGNDGGEDAGEAYVIYGTVTTEGQVFVGNGGFDDFNGTDGVDVIVGIAGNDVAFGGLGGDLIIGGFDSDYLEGEIGDDVIIGDNNDLIAGADVLIGGVGDDLLEGGGGADMFVFFPNNGHDTIGQISADYDDPQNALVIGVDFVNGVDLIVLDGFDFANRLEALDAISDVNGVATFSSEGTTITFTGLTAADFTVDDFSFGFE